MIRAMRRSIVVGSLVEGPNEADCDATVVDPEALITDTDQM